MLENARPKEKLIFSQKKKKEDDEAEKQKALFSKVRGPVTGKDYLISKSQGEIQIAEEIIVSTNLPFPRQHLAFENQEFLVETIESLEKTTFTMPFTLQKELTGAVSIADQKYVKCEFLFDGTYPTLPEANVVLGEKPVTTLIGFRKGLHTVNNRTVLKLLYDEFMNLVKEGRVMIAMAQHQVNRQVNRESLSTRDVILRESTSQDGKETIVLLRMSYRSGDDNPNKVFPVINIREFFEDPKTRKFRASPRGVTLGLRAFYRLVYPITKTMITMQDSFIQIKRNLDTIKERAEVEMQILKQKAPENSWEPDKERSTEEDAENFQSIEDDLGLLETSQSHYEKEISSHFGGEPQVQVLEEISEEDEQDDEIDYEIE